MSQIIIDQEILTVTKYDYFQEEFDPTGKPSDNDDERYIEFNGHELQSLVMLKKTGHIEQYELMKSLKKGDKVKRTVLPHPDYKYLLKSIYEKIE